VSPANGAAGFQYLGLAAPLRPGVPVELAGQRKAPPKKDGSSHGFSGDISDMVRGPGGVRQRGCRSAPFFTDRQPRLAA
jgi:hypothetical protein